MGLWLWMLGFATSGASAAGGSLAPGVSWRTQSHEGSRYRVVTVDLRSAEVELVGQRRGAPHRASDLAGYLGDGWVAATNAGLYHTIHRPVGLHIERGAVLSALELATGSGNFFLMPNGVFTIDGLGARVVESTRYHSVGEVVLATQSGPALVLDGVVHPQLRPDSPSHKIRSGVGVSDGYTVHLVLSEDKVRFHALATLFRDVLDCSDALYLDGHISGMWGPELPPSAQNQRYASFLVVGSSS